MPGTGGIATGAGAGACATGAGAPADAGAGATGAGAGAAAASRCMASRWSSSSLLFNPTTCSSLISTSARRLTMICAASDRWSPSSRTTSKSCQLPVSSTSAHAFACPNVRPTAASEVCRSAVASVATTSDSAACASAASNAWADSALCWRAPVAPAA
ncbi:hypothetical protein C3Z06_23630 [Cupriavidus metallidurans]|nr:hypothetical protein C3Z06_23630 [Cupriavidus metallidurans]